MMIVMQKINPLSKDSSHFFVLSKDNSNFVI
jgi:hypothetical protein